MTTQQNPADTPPPRAKNKGIGRAVFSLLSGKRAWELLWALCILLVMFGNAIDDNPFFPDESQWIHTSQCLESFVTGDVFSPVWAQSYWTLTQPPLARYIMGVGRLAGGFGIKDLNSPWNFDLDAEANYARQAMPSASLLWWSRFPMGVIAILSCLIWFRLIRSYAGAVVACFLLMLLAFNTYLGGTLFMAMSESPLLFLVTLTAWAGCRAMKSWKTHVLAAELDKPNLMPPLLWLSLMAVFCGAAGAAKLNGLPLAGAAAFLSVIAVLFGAGRLSSAKRWALSTQIIILPQIAMLVFILLNPFLYTHTKTKIAAMASLRIGEMTAPKSAFHTATVTDGAKRILLVCQRIFEDYATIRFPFALELNLSLFLVGLLKIARDARRWSRPTVGNEAALVLAAVCVAVALPAAFTPLDWARYYLLPVVFSSILIAIGAGAILRLVERQIANYWRESKQFRA